MKVTMNLMLKQLLLHSTAVGRLPWVYMQAPYQPYWLAPLPEPELVITGRQEGKNAAYKAAYGGKLPPAKLRKGR